MLVARDPEDPTRRVLAATKMNLAPEPCSLGFRLEVAGTLAFIDIDSMQKRVYGHQKQGARFGHTKIQGKPVLVRGLKEESEKEEKGHEVSMTNGVSNGLGDYGLPEGRL